MVAEACLENGWMITSPGGDARSGIISAWRDGVDIQAIVEHLENFGIRTSTRDGALRVSPHIYNDQNDIDRLAKTLKSA